MIARRARQALIVFLPVAACAAVALFAPIDAGWPGWREEMSPRDYRALADLSGRVSRRQLEENLALIDPAGLLTSYVTVTDTAAAIRIEPTDSDPVTVVALAREDQPPPPRPASVAEMRILVDPGHFGGVWSETESRHVQMDERAPVREGTLTWAVGRLLSAKLAAAGADVRLTRGPPPTESFPSGLDAGFDPDVEAGLVLAERLADPGTARWVRLYPSIIARCGLRQRRAAIRAEEGLFSLYSRYDLRRRAALAGELAADVTVSLHFNISGWRNDNWLILFIPGNFMPGEVATPSQRYWAIRRALDGQYPVMLELGRAIMREMHNVLQVPIVQYVEKPDAIWPKKLLADADLGVYARNLAVLRRTQGPVVLVEGPPLDNASEYEKLHEGGLAIDGADYPPRVGEYAQAVAEGLRVWAESGRTGSQ